MKSTKPMKSGNQPHLNGLTNSHLQAGHKPLGKAQIAAVAAKAKARANTMAEASEMPDADDAPQAFAFGGKVSKAKC